MSDRPPVVCLCGSTRFWREFQRASLVETIAGRIVLTIGAATGTDDEHFGNLPAEENARIKEDLDQLHLRKVEMADEVLILNVDGYIGESTARELAHAYALGKRIRFLEREMGKVTAALQRAAEMEAEGRTVVETPENERAEIPESDETELTGPDVSHHDWSPVRCASVERRFAIDDRVVVLQSVPEFGIGGQRGRVLRWICRDGEWFYTVVFDPDTQGFWTIAEQHLTRDTADANQPRLIQQR